MPDFKDTTHNPVVDANVPTAGVMPTAGAIRQNDGMYHHPTGTVGAPHEEPLKGAKPFDEQLRSKEEADRDPKDKPTLSKKDPVPEKIPVADDGQGFDMAAQDRHDSKSEPGAGDKIKGLGSRAAANIEHAARATGEAIQSATGTLNAVDMLTHQHKETLHFFERIQSNKDPKTRHRLLEDMCDGLTARMRVEEEIFYPAMAQEGLRSWEHVSQSVEEHNEVKRIMTELLQLNPGEALFDAKLDKFKIDLDKHVEEERNVFFPQVKEKLESKKLKELGKEMHQKYSKLMGEKHTRYMAFEDVGKPVPTKETREPADKS